MAAVVNPSAVACTETLLRRTSAGTAQLASSGSLPARPILTRMIESVSAVTRTVAVPLLISMPFGNDRDSGAGCAAALGDPASASATAVTATKNKMRLISPELVDYGGISGEEAAINGPATPLFVAAVIAVSGFASLAIAGEKFGRGSPECQFHLAL